MVLNCTVIMNITTCDASLCNVNRLQVGRRKKRIWLLECATEFKSLVICIYRQRRKFVVFDNAKKCYMFPSKRPSSGINLHDSKKQVKCVKSILKLVRFRKFYHHRNNGILDILFCATFTYSERAALIKNAC
jgi:hypothetical protein